MAAYFTVLCVFLAAICGFATTFSFNPRYDYELSSMDQHLNYMGRYDRTQMFELSMPESYETDSSAEDINPSILAIPSEHSVYPENREQAASSDDVRGNERESIGEFKEFHQKDIDALEGTEAKYMDAFDGIDAKDTDAPVVIEDGIDALAGITAKDMDALEGITSKDIDALEGIQAIHIDAPAAIEVDDIVPPEGTEAQDIDAFARIEAEDNDYNVSVRLVSHDGGVVVGYINQGDVIGFRRVNFQDGASGVLLRVSSGNPLHSPTRVHLHLDSADNEPLVTVHVDSTGGWSKFRTLRLFLPTTPRGVHDLYFTFSDMNANSAIADINWFQFFRKVEDTNQ